MKMNVLSFGVVVSTLFAGCALSSAQQTDEPKPVISSPKESVPASRNSGSEGTTGSKITSAVENLLGRFLGRNGSQISFEQLPQPVQRTVREQAGTAPIQSVSQVSTNGQTNYVVTFNRSGQNVNLQVDPAGRILKSGQFGTNTLPGQPNSDVVGRAPGSIPDWRTAPVRQPLSDARSVEFDTLPDSVRSTFLRYAGAGAIGKVQKGTLEGMTVYQAQLTPNGQRIDLRVAESGGLLNDQINDRFLALSKSGQANTSTGQPATWQRGSSSGFAPLSDSIIVPFDELPLAVQTTISAQGDGAAVDRVIQGTIDGRTAYDATYTQGGQTVKVRVGDDGSVLGSRRLQQ